MALTSAEKATLAELIRVPHPDLVSGELQEVLPDQETRLKADLARYDAIKGKYGSLNGHNASGVVFNPKDEIAAIRKRAIVLLNCAETVNAYAANNTTGGGAIIRG